MNSSTLKRKYPSPDLILPAFAQAHRPKKGMVFPDLRSLGMLRGIAGGSGGINAEADVLTQTADGRDLNDIWNEFQTTVGVQNRERQTIVDFLTFTVNNPVEDVPQVAGGVDFEVASEFGEPKGARQPGAYFSLGYTFEWYDLAARFTWKYLAEATAQQVEAVHQAVLEADNRLVFNQVLRTVFNPDNLVANINQRPYNVYKFYNGDGTVPPAWKTNVFDGTHTHYLTSGAAVIDSGDLDDVYEHIRHHGYGTVESGSRVVAMVNKAQADTIRQFRSIANGGTATYDFVPAQGTTPFILPPNVAGVAGQQVPNELAGLNVIGSYGPLLIIEEDYVPIGYVFVFATGGRANLQNPVGIREHANPALRGLRLVKGRDNNYPLIDSFYQRGFGTGVRQRGAGVVMQITAAGAYAPPALYA